MIDVLYQFRRQALQWLCQACAKERIDEQVICIDQWKIFFCLDIMNIGHGHVVESLQVGLKVMTSFFSEFKNVNGYAISLLQEQPGNSESVTAIVSFPAKILQV